MGSLATPECTGALPFERRLRAEWVFLGRLAELNRNRLVDLTASDSAFHLTLRETPALSVDRGAKLSTHRLQVTFPRFFPAVPLELSLAAPVFHPNIHPVSGFVCLWDRHAAANTVEQALHRTVAILGWSLLNADPRHTMQPAALQLSPEEGAALRRQLAAAPLRGVAPSPAEPAPAAFRRRLS